MKKLLSTLALVAGVNSAGAFALHGPLDAWQDPTIGYGYAGDIGGVMNLNGFYRLNAPVVYYSFDDAFLTYFGQKGVEAVEDAISILNALPPVSSINPDDYPQRAVRLNARAQALNLMDLKSVTLFTLVEEMGLTSAPRYVFTLRTRIDTPTPCIAFTVLRRNFDPVTLRTSSFINGDLWTYRDIFCSTQPQQAWPINEAVDPLAARFNEPVAACFSQAGYFSHFGVGQFFTGLTRDDVGGLRFIYRAANQVYETAPPLTTGGAGGPWAPPPLGTNATGTNTFIATAYRRGLEKITFVRAGAYDALLGQLFQPITNRYNEVISTNGLGGGEITQTVERAVIVPDILFSGQDSTFPPLLWTRTIPWAPGPVAAETGNAGPGIVVPGIRVDYNIMGPMAGNQGAFLAETNATPFSTWAYFNSSTNITVFPDGSSIDSLESFVWQAGGGSQWTPPSGTTGGTTGGTGGGAGGGTAP